MCVCASVGEVEDDDHDDDDDPPRQLSPQLLYDYYYIR